MSESNQCTLIKNQRSESLPQLEDFVANDIEKTSGRIGFIKLNSGINLHFSDLTELVDGQSESMSEACLTISLMLEGQLKFYMDDKPYYLGAENTHKNRICGKMWSTTKPVKFTRRFQKGRKIKKIIINIDRDWLSEMGLSETMPARCSSLDQNLKSFASSHLTCKEWTPCQAAIKAAEDIIEPPHKADCMKQIVRECRAMELVTLAFEQFSHSSEITKPATKNNCRLIKVHSYIEDNLENDLTLEDIAKNVGFSISSLQRHFKAVYGSTVVDYIRKRKLELAKDAIKYEGLPVSEACFIAGYSNPSSFATAFKRAFGQCPRLFLDNNR